MNADNPPYLEDFVIGKRQQAIWLTLSVSNPFDKKLKGLILNGVTQKITLNTTTSEKKSYLFLVNSDRLMAENTISQSITYDNLKKVFVVAYEGRQPELTTTSYPQALAAVSTFADINLLELQHARPKTRYEVKVQAEIRKTRLPFHLEYLFFFLSAWDRKTQTYVLDIPDQFLPAAQQ